MSGGEERGRGRREHSLIRGAREGKTGGKEGRGQEEKRKGRHEGGGGRRKGACSMPALQPAVRSVVHKAIAVLGKGERKARLRRDPEESAHRSFPSAKYLATRSTTRI